MTRAAVCCAVVVAFAAPAAAQYQPPGNPLWNAPTGYYDLATGTGTTLKQQLYNTISVGFNEATKAHAGNLTTRTYGDLRYAARVLFKDTSYNPADPAQERILWVYDRTSATYVWDAGETWNREHSWPRSKLGIGTTGNDYVGPGSDMFEVYPASASENSSRGNAGYGVHPYAGDYGLNNGYWYPGSVDRGDVARSMFYMATRYAFDQNGQAREAPQNLTLVNGQGAVGAMGDLASLLRYHYEDGVDNFERRRNHITYSPDSGPNGWDTAGRPALYNQVYNQGNRNPFIDRPEYVWAIWGTGANNSKIYIGPTAPGDGASTAAVNLRVIKGSAWGSAGITITKEGAHPTTYDLTTAGSAATAAAGVGQPFNYDPVTRAITVSLNASTAAVGAAGGTITINNTDLTTASPGRGSTDGNDTINITGAVLDHAQPSFVAGAVNATGATYDFGYVPAGGAARAMTFDVHNNPTAAGGVTYTAGLDVDGVTRTGSTRISTNVVAGDPNAPLAAGGSRAYTATFTPDAGNALAAATHTIATSDENIPGATPRANLVLTTTGRSTNGTFPVTGTLHLLSGETFNTTSFNIADDAAVTKQGPGTMNVNGSHGHGATAALVADGGAVNFFTDANGTAAAGLAVTAASAPVTFHSDQHLRALNVQGEATVAPAGDRQLVVGALSMAAGARLDLNDNDLVVRNGNAGAVIPGSGGTYSGVQGDVQRGYNVGMWDGNGIVTGITAAEGGLTTLGVAPAGEVLGFDGDTVLWNGQTVAPSDVLVMYTHTGDANLDGAVDGGDYAFIDVFVGAAPADVAYYKGDFNYDGAIDGGDYAYIDVTVGATPSMAGASSAGAPLAAVPEPAGICAAALVAAAVLARRRRHLQH